LNWALDSEPISRRIRGPALRPAAGDLVILRLRRGRRGSSQPSRYRICRVMRRPIRHPDKKARSGRRRRCGQKEPIIYFVRLSSFPPNVK